MFFFFFWPLCDTRHVLRGRLCVEQAEGTTALFFEQGFSSAKPNQLRGSCISGCMPRGLLTFGRYVGIEARGLTAVTYTMISL